jgi:DNA-binding NarL/FixJ family response regulator
VDSRQSFRWERQVRPGSLTAQEREIADLAASGLTNKQIAEQLRLSPRTVGTHLRHVFPKLDVSSRAALRDALGQTSRAADAQPANLPGVVLTEQELEIASLAASGLSNKEIGGRLYLSHRTVGAHLYQLFPRLGIRSRAGLRDALARYSLEPAPPN